MKSSKNILWFNELSIQHVPEVGGKSASLGEMYCNLKSAGVKVPNGFAVTASAYCLFLDANDLRPAIQKILDKLANRKLSLQGAGKKIRNLILQGSFPEDMKNEILQAYQQLNNEYTQKSVDVAVRSSATAEYLPQASFAGQHESYLNVRGPESLLEHCKRCMASLFTDRAITYREINGFDHMKVALSVTVQKMVRSDKAGSGVIFTIDTESGFEKAVVINAVWGLGESIVQGISTPDEYKVFKPFLSNAKLKPIIRKSPGDKEICIVYAGKKDKKKKLVIEKPASKKKRSRFVLNDDEIIQLGHWANSIEKHYQKPMDIEWAKDGKSGELFIIQARPETVHSQKDNANFRQYHLESTGKEIIHGLAIGEGISIAKAQIIRSVKDMGKFVPGSILVTVTTDPDWLPRMKKAAGIITDHGGRTSHAAIISRELGVPAIVGCKNATSIIKKDETITLSCVEGEKGKVYQGTARYTVEDVDIEKLPKCKTRIFMNIASPEAAFRWWRLPADGIGLARMEFIIAQNIKIHPLALSRFKALKNKKLKSEIEQLTGAFKDKRDFFIDNLAFGIAGIAASQYPKPVILRTSDFKTNEYANLIGGSGFEPHEENPMIGFRGASRYYSEDYRDGFALECMAIRKVREEMGFDNISVMIPFCRTLEEADLVLAEMEKHGLNRGKNGLEIYVMCEIPANVILAEQFAERFDGFSIGSNDLTQLTLGIDRDSDKLTYLFDERNDAVKSLILEVIAKAHKSKKHVGICGQAPSDYPEFARFLVESGIDSISLNPDKVIAVRQQISEFEKVKAES